MALKYVWNEDKTRSVKISQIKEFYIIEDYRNVCTVKALMTEEGTIVITSGLLKQEAEKFIEKLVEEIG